MKDKMGYTAPTSDQRTFENLHRVEKFRVFLNQVEGLEASLNHKGGDPALTELVRPHYESKARELIDFVRKNKPHLDVYVAHNSSHRITGAKVKSIEYEQLGDGTDLLGRLISAIRIAYSTDEWGDSSADRSIELGDLYKSISPEPWLFGHRQNGFTKLRAGEERGTLVAEHGRIQSRIINDLRDFESRTGVSIWIDDPSGVL